MAVVKVSRQDQAQKRKHPVLVGKSKKPKRPGANDSEPSARFKER